MELFDHNSISHWKKYFYYPVMLFGNVVINKIPSRHIRKWYAQLLGARIGNSYFFRRVEILFPKGLLIGDNSNVGWFTLLDARCTKICIPDIISVRQMDSRRKN